MSRSPKIYIFFSLVHGVYGYFAKSGDVSEKVAKTAISAHCTPAGHRHHGPGRRKCGYRWEPPYLSTWAAGYAPSSSRSGLGFLKRPRGARVTDAILGGTSRLSAFVKGYVLPFDGPRSVTSQNGRWKPLQVEGERSLHFVREKVKSKE